MASKQAQQGFIYEQNAVKALRPLGIVPLKFKPAGAGSDKPDIMLMKNGKEAGCELKISPAASGGSLVIKWKKGGPNGGWYFDKPDAVEKDKLFMKELAERVNIFKLISKQWTNEPYKYATSPDIVEQRDKLDRDPNREAKYRADLNRFKEINGPIESDNLEKYYNTKETYYLNIGTTGFYLLGPSNPLKLTNPTPPRFNAMAKLGFRCRVQGKGKDKKGSGTYQFTFEMSIKGAKKSLVNIAPLNKGSVTINKISLNTDWFTK